MERTEKVVSESTNCKSSNVASDHDAKAFTIWSFFGCFWKGFLKGSFAGHEKIWLKRFELDLFEKNKIERVTACCPNIKGV